MQSILTVSKRLLGLAILFSLLLSTAAFAQKAHKTDDGASAEETATFEAQVRQMINRSGEGLTVYTLDNGTKVADLEGRFQSVALAKKDANGNVATTCVTTQKEADRFLKSEAKPAKKAGSKLAKKPAHAAEVK